jgi:hypothetical protein
MFYGSGFRVGLGLVRVCKKIKIKLLFGFDATHAQGDNQDLFIYFLKKNQLLFGFDATHAQGDHQDGRAPRADHALQTRHLLGFRVSGLGFRVHALHTRHLFCE